MTTQFNRWSTKRNVSDDDFKEFLKEQSELEYKCKEKGIDYVSPYCLFCGNEEKSGNVIDAKCKYGEIYCCDECFVEMYKRIESYAVPYLHRVDLIKKLFVDYLIGEDLIDNYEYGYCPLCLNEFKIGEGLNENGERSSGIEKHSHPIDDLFDVLCNECSLELFMVCNKKNNVSYNEMDYSFKKLLRKFFEPRIPHDDLLKTLFGLEELNEQKQEVLEKVKEETVKEETEIKNN